MTTWRDITDFKNGLRLKKDRWLRHVREYFMKPSQKAIKEFLKHSNWIEREYRPEALEDALKAWNHLMTVGKDLEAKDILDVHHILAGRINPSIAGRFRQCDVLIGGRRKYYISDDSMYEEVRGALKDINYLPCNDKSENLEGIARKAHVRFESVHPFEDGNGRTGRLLWAWQLIRYGLKLPKIEGPKEGKGITKFQKEYYGWFKNS